MADALSPPEVSLFLFLVKLRRFDDATLGVLRTLLVSKDARSAVQARSSLERFMRFESLRILREVADKDAVHVLSVLEFLVRAFAVIGDFEACENALLCLQRSDTSGLENFTGDIQNIVSLKDVAISSTGSCSVQAKAVKYLKRKEMERSKQQASTFREIQPVASVLFRDSIKKRNARIFSECQALRSAARNSHAHTKIPGFV
ncbi:uncharacterized protein LOC115683885 isoform X3 [Syzygium oleosum]|uniref:uncharacterized protein LOC115683885 isoform X3 n=1 Tax=Syzygium oleosum TaxID=219896 RepID=UPI0024B9B818|nr:uncharacterized protein LOC115683885 isoform X3 [Syzygium oleosum]